MFSRRFFLPLFFFCHIVTIGHAVSAEKSKLSVVVIYIMDDELADIPAPTGLSVQAVGESNQLSWQSSDDDYLYKIQQAQNGGEYTTIMATQELTASIEDAVNNRYRYRVAACSVTADFEHCSVWSEPSEVVGELPAISTISLVSSTQAAGNAIIAVGFELDTPQNYFLPVTYIVEYQVNGGSWFEGGAFSEPEFNFSPEAVGSFSFRVKACVGEDDNQICSATSAPSETIDLTPYIAKPDARLNHGAYNYITFFWDEVPYADSYLIRVYKDDDVIFSATITDLEIIFDDSLPRGERLDFTVVACQTDGMCSSASDMKGSTPLLWSAPDEPPIDDIHHTNNNLITYSWEEVSNIDKYELLVTDNGTLVYSETTTALEVVFPNTLPQSNPLLFKVRACFNEGQCSDYSEGQTATPLSTSGQPPALPLSFNISVSESTQYVPITLSWTMGKNRPFTFNLFSQLNDEATELLLTGVSDYQLEYVPAHSGAMIFELQACDEYGCGDRKAVSLNVIESYSTSSSPVVNYFRWNPQTTTVGQSTQFEWDISNVQSCTTTASASGYREASGIIGPLTSDAAGTSITEWFCTDLEGNRYPSDGYIAATRTVLDEPSISTFEWVPALVAVGQETYFEWDIQNVQSCTSNVSGEQPISGSLGPYTFDVTGSSTTQWSCIDLAGNRYPDDENLFIEAVRTVGDYEAPEVIEFGWQPATIIVGEEAYFHWNITNVTGCVNQWAEGRAASGTIGPITFDEPEVRVTQWYCTDLQGNRYPNDPEAFIEAPHEVITEYITPEVATFEWQPSVVKAGQETTFVWDIRNVQYCESVVSGEQASSGEIGPLTFYSPQTSITQWFCIDLNGDRYPSDASFLEASRVVEKLAAPQNITIQEE